VQPSAFAVVENVPSGQSAQARSLVALPAADTCCPARHSLQATQPAPGLVANVPDAHCFALFLLVHPTARALPSMSQRVHRELQPTKLERSTRFILTTSSERVCPLFEGHGPQLSPR
jgi:hypothetical protein